ncbi:hypothetical protein FQR65_LT16528 [Abscondita terminalis]|nr:hypothetical protein FQR65_LT16528 [Abscondita terminalis]
MRWSERETVKFVELYREHECLWDVTKPCYRNNQMRQAALEQIVQTMEIEDFTIADARQKVKSLRNTYSQELQKIDKSIKSGMGGDDIYTPAVKWFKIMDSFMRHSKAKRATQSNLDSQATEHNQQINIEEADIVDHGTVEEDERPVSIIPQTPKPTKSNKQSVLPNSLTAKKRRHQELTTAVSELRQLNQNLQEPVAEEDEFDCFGRYMGLALKKLPTNLAVQCQAELHSTITKYRLLSVAPSNQCTSPASNHSGMIPTPSDTSEYSAVRASPNSNNTLHSHENFYQHLSPYASQDYEETLRDLPSDMSQSIAGTSTDTY